MILDQIIADRKIAVEVLKQSVKIVDLEKQIMQSTLKHYNFKAALQSKARPIQIIAEVKKASPSKGIIHESFPYLQIAKAYERGGAAAISVLTESKYFKGDNAYLTAIKQEVNLPLLRKDFIVDPIQIYEAKVIGADAILLIVAALSKEQLKSYLEIATHLELDVLVEAHTYEEVENALEIGADIIGVNNRNLQTFEVNLETTERLRAFIPRDKVLVSESGIHTKEDVKRLKQLEVNALLIGESMMRSSIPEVQLQSFIEA